MQKNQEEHPTLRKSFHSSNTFKKEYADAQGDLFNYF